MDKPSTIPTWFAFAANIIIAAASFIALGWTRAGAHAAARNTARFAALCFLLAFAAPGLARWFSDLRNEGRVTQSYVAAHLVHFVSVAALLLAFERAHLAQAPGKSAAVVLVGLVIVLTAGITAGRPSRLINTVAMYAIFVIFMLAFVHNPVKPLRIMAVLLGAALVLRLTARLPNARAADVSEPAPSRTSEPN